MVEIAVDHGQDAPADHNLTVRVGVLHRMRRWLLLPAVAPVLALFVAAWLAANRTGKRPVSVGGSDGNPGRVSKPAAGGGSPVVVFSAAVAAIPVPAGRPETGPVTESLAPHAALVPSEPVQGKRGLEPAAASGGHRIGHRRDEAGSPPVREVPSKARRRSDSAHPPRPAPELAVHARPESDGDTALRAGRLSSDDF